MTYIPPFELALIRWSIVCIRWNDFSMGIHPENRPNITAFLAGWGCRCVGIPLPHQIDMFVESFRVGWAEADTVIAIELQSRKP